MCYQPPAIFNILFLYFHASKSKEVKKQNMVNLLIINLIPLLLIIFQAK